MKINNKIKKFFLAITSIFFILLLYNENIEQRPQETKEVVIAQPFLVEVEKEKEVEKEIYIEVEPKNHYSVSSVDREMIARLLYREAGATSLECQKMVVSVIFNRYDADEEATLYDIVYEKGQFSPASLIYRTTPTEENYEAVDYVIKNGSVLPSYVKYFRADYHFNWEGYYGYTSIDGVYFGYLDRDKNDWQF